MKRSRQLNVRSDFEKLSVRPENFFNEICVISLIKKYKYKLFNKRINGLSYKL